MFPVSLKREGGVSSETQKQSCFKCFKLRFSLFTSLLTLYNLSGTPLENSGGFVSFPLVTLLKS